MQRRPGSGTLSVFRFVASYLALIGFILVVVAIVFFLFFVPRYEEEVTMLNRSRLATMSLLLDSLVLEPLDLMYLRVLNEGFDTGYFSSQGQKPEHNIYRVYATHLELRAMTREYPGLLESVSIYYPRVDFINSSRGFLFLDRARQPGSLTFGWLPVRDFDGGLEWAITEEEKSYSYIDPETEPVLVAMKSIPLHAAPELRLGAVFFSIKVTYLNSLLSEHLPHGTSHFTVTDRSGRLLYSYPQDAGGLDLPADRGELVTASTESATGVWTYTLSVPQEIYFERSHRMRLVALLLTVALLAGGAGVSVVLSRRTYRPILRIVDSATDALTTLGWDPHTMPADHFHFLRDSFRRVSSHVEDLHATIARNLPVVKHNLFAGLLRGVEFSDQELQDKLEFLQLSLTGARYRVILVHLDLSGTASHAAELLKLGLVHGFESTTDAFIYGIEYKKNAIALIVNHDEKSAVDWVLQRVEGLLASNDAGKSGSFKIAVGTECDSLTSINGSIAGAEEAMQYYFFFPDACILHADSVLTDRRDGLLATLFDPEEFARIVRDLDPEKVERYLDEVTRRFFEHRVSVETARHVLMEMMAATAVAIQQQGTPVSDGSVDALFQDCTASRSLKEFASRFLSFVRTAREAARMHRDRFHNTLIEQIKQHVRAHLSDDLSLRAISDRFHVSYSHLSVLFKQVSAKNFSEFVNDCRMERARELLSGHELNVDEIARQVGFSDTGYFIRRFKVAFGLTPGEFKLKKTIESTTTP
jgi:AraC-like DNA-binding protein